MSGVVKVGIADLKIAKGDSTLITIGLGSCVGICIHDPVAKIGGLAHIMLPDGNISVRGKQKPMKYADTAIPMLVERMLEAGAFKSRFVTKIAGGATMFSSFGKKKSINIGEQNIAAVKKVLGALNLRIASEDTGKDFSRTVKFYIKSGTVLVKTDRSERKL